MTPNTITFQATDNTWVMRITADRRIEVNEDVEVTEAAQKVLDAMQYFLTQQRTWVGLTDEDIENAYIRTEHFVDMAKVLDDILKEKNHG
jgi:predicted RNA binding protein with dsRBD fold (UPF0201 family)